MKNLLKLNAILFGIVLVLSSCGRSERSDITGWKVNDQKWGGFEKQSDYKGQEAGPNLVLIEGVRSPWEILNRMFCTPGIVFQEG